MIKIVLGNIGSGKTAFVVREIALNHMNRKTYSNIKTRLPNQTDINANMIIKREIIDHKKKRSGELEPVYKDSLNSEFWRSIKEPINVVLDEAHSILNSRRSMSKTNIIVGDWLALLRRVLGSSDSGYGELILISQLGRKLDVNSRDMATNVIYTVCHFHKTCSKCGLTYLENSEMPELTYICPDQKCQSIRLKKHTHYLELWHFQDMSSYEAWREFGAKTYYKHYYCTDIEDYFKYYDTLQWESLFQNFY